jgi:putative spermidine/putrescine transport system ATP-binding protein
MNGRYDVELVAVTKRYGGTVAVDNIDLRIVAKSYCCLLGPSGCGKTTTLRMIAGHETVSDGDILITDQNVTNLPPAKRGTAMMFQSYALFPHLNCIDNVAFGLKMRGIAKAARHAQAREFLELMQMSALADRLPAQLSGGQQQRVAVARALAGRPSILLADEPTGNLDSVNGEQVMGLLSELHQEGATICMVTHDPRYARCADRTITLFDGRIVEEQIQNAAQA